MAPLSTNELIGLVAIMQAMHKAAAVANWQELSRLDSERRTLLNYDPSYMPPLGKSQTADTTALDAQSEDRQVEHLGSATTRIRLIDQIHTIDQQIIATIRSARTKLLAENRELTTRLKAKKLYAQTSLMS